MNKLQYVSDIHLELRKEKDIPIIKPVDNETYLSLCGDIGNPFMPTYRKFLEIHAPLFKHILIVSGNHEYYTSQKKQRTMERVDEKIKEIVNDFDNVTYLNMDKVIISRTKFIGCSFWTDISNIKYLAESIMNDYKNIYIRDKNRLGHFVNIQSGYRIQRKWIKDKRRRLAGSDTVKLHREMKEWITKQIDKYDSSNEDNKYDHIIVLTHHAPSFSMLNKSDLYSPCYGSDCDDLFRGPVRAWISGHTHVSVKVEINGRIAASNCMGYPGQKVQNYDTSAYIEFH